jgi:hypothetical protein
MNSTQATSDGRDGRTGGFSEHLRDFFAPLREHPLVWFLLFVVLFVGFSAAYYCWAKRAFTGRQAFESLVVSIEATDEVGDNFVDSKKHHEAFVMTLRQNSARSPMDGWVKAFHRDIHPATRLEKALNFLGTDTNSDREAKKLISQAATEIDSYFQSLSDYASPKPIAYPSVTSEIGQDVVGQIESAMDSFGLAVQQLQDNQDKTGCLDTCMASRKASISLFLNWPEYTSSASRERRAKIDEFAENLEVARDLVGNHAESLPDTDSNKNLVLHYSQSLARRLEILNALKSNNVSRLRTILLEERDRIRSGLAKAG